MSSALTLKKRLGDPAQVAGNLRAWTAAFDPETEDVIEKSDFDAQIGRLDRAKLLYLVLSPTSTPSSRRWRRRSSGCRAR